jgi:hypothetical protein
MLMATSTPCTSRAELADMCSARLPAERPPLHAFTGHKHTSIAGVPAEHVTVYVVVEWHATVHQLRAAENVRTSGRVNRPAVAAEIQIPRLQFVLQVCQTLTYNQRFKTWTPHSSRCPHLTRISDPAYWPGAALYRALPLPSTVLCGRQCPRWVG